MPCERLDGDVGYMTVVHQCLVAEIAEHRDHALYGRARRVLGLVLLEAREGAQIAKMSAPQQALTYTFCTWGEIAYSTQS